MRTQATAQRLVALAVLLCWLWFGAVSPFEHTCRIVDGPRVALSADADTACISCLWLACNQTASVPPPPALPAPRAIAPIYPVSVTSPALAPFHPLPSRAPPA